MPRRTLHDSRAIVTGAIQRHRPCPGPGTIHGAERTSSPPPAAASFESLSAKRSDWEPNARASRAIFRSRKRAASLIAAAHERSGGLDLLVNNAGVGAIRDFDCSVPATELRQVMEVNFFAAVEMTRASLPLLRAGRNL